MHILPQSLQQLPTNDYIINYRCHNVLFFESIPHSNEYIDIYTTHPYVWLLSFHTHTYANALMLFKLSTLHAAFAITHTQQSWPQLADIFMIDTNM